MNYRFSGHRTFVFRYGWLEKGVDLVRSNPKGFLADDSIVKLGVGKNMVESIKYWCQQTGLITDSAVCLGGYEHTDFAKFREFARNVKGLSERFKAACIPYANVSAALSAVERKKVDAISKKIREVASGAPGLVRAALLICLQELDGTENA